MTGADLATVGHIDAVLAELREVRAELAAVREALPSRWLNLGEAAELLGVDARTVSAMAKRGELVTRRAGRRVLVAASSLRPVDAAAIAALAAEARR